MKKIKRSVLLSGLLLILGFTLCSVNAEQTIHSLQFKSNHPPEWIVKKTDTQHSIANMFLENPWRWNHAWGDKPAPAYIYPGDKIIVRESKPRSYLVYHALNNKSNHLATVKLGPKIIATNIDNAPNVQKSQITPLYTKLKTFMLKGNIFKNQTVIDDFPKIIGFKENKFIGTTGQNVYAKEHSLFTSSDYFNVFRQSDTYKYDHSEKVMGVETSYAGKVVINGRDGKLLRLKIVSAVKEIRSGDILVPVNLVVADSSDFKPHSEGYQSTVIRSKGIGESSGKYASVVIKGGIKQGIKRGQLFSVYNQPETITNSDSEYAFTSDKPVGRLLVYSTFDNLSYALVLKASESVEKGDILKSISL